MEIQKDKETIEIAMEFAKKLQEDIIKNPNDMAEILKIKAAGTKIELKDVHKRYQELLHIEETDRIDIVLATALSNTLKGVPLWLILVGASGDMKSVQLNAIKGFQTYYLHKFTSKTLVNGFPNKDKYPDLAPKLNGHIVVIRDMASLLKLAPIEKGEVWGQLRDLYDGFAGSASGMGTDTKYEGIKITLLAGSTPAIDGQILVHQDLGTRELIYRTKGNKNKSKMMDKCITNEEFEESITKELNNITLNFLKEIKIERESISLEILENIKDIATYISYMRATADMDSYENILRMDVCPEEPSRVIKQLKRLFICLKALDKNYLDNTALRILWDVAKSSAFQIRIKVLNYLLNQYTELSTSKLAEEIKIGKGTVQKELSILWNMGLVNLRKEETKYPDKFYDYWQLNRENTFIKRLEIYAKMF